MNHFDTDIAWCVELLTEWAAEETTGVRRGGRAWLDSEIDADSDEMRALKTAIDRLRREHVEEYAAVVAEFKTRGLPRRAQGFVVLQSAVTRLAVWVDEALEGDQ